MSVFIAMRLCWKLNVAHESWIPIFRSSSLSSGNLLGLKKVSTSFQSLPLFSKSRLSHFFYRRWAATDNWAAKPKKTTVGCAPETAPRAVWSEVRGCLTCRLKNVGAHMHKNIVEQWWVLTSTSVTPNVLIFLNMCLTFFHLSGKGIFLVWGHQRWKSGLEWRDGEGQREFYLTMNVKPV